MTKRELCRSRICAPFTLKMDLFGILSRSVNHRRHRAADNVLLIADADAERALEWHLLDNRDQLPRIETEVTKVAEAVAVALEHTGDACWNAIRQRADLATREWF